MHAHEPLLSRDARGFDTCQNTIPDLAMPSGGPPGGIDPGRRLVNKISIFDPDREKSGERYSTGAMGHVFSFHHISLKE
jgi:hypothetical protein